MIKKNEKITNKKIINLHSKFYDIMASNDIFFDIIPKKRHQSSDVI